MYQEYLDIESQETITLAELKAEFEQLQQDEPWNVDGMTFADYLENCLTANNGTLEPLT